ncbi:type II toxin-antitoxin system RelE/ParE family toxin, partial [Acidaminococcus timonensis]|uniref:type II toxin-antitoxin system RelE/ParE family toxin n=1 Tax=Acidaminococcus timonensis TaxID=1871002 RepID=UPI002941E722
CHKKTNPQLLDFWSNNWGAAHNPIAAASFFHQLQDKIKETCQFPHSGSEINNEYLPWPAIRFQVVGSYLFYYEADHKNKTIIILRIVYGPRNQEEIQMELKK